VAGKGNLYLAVDVGGTNIQAAAVEASGLVIARKKRPSPRGVGPQPVIEAIEGVIRDLLAKGALAGAPKPAAIGIAIPGVVDPADGQVVVTPNMELSGVPIGPRLERTFKTPVVLGNDCNLGTLGEKWLGAARGAESVVGILVGTGIGGGFAQGSRLWRGARESAAEIGHIVMQIDGPMCGCGNRGCFEALASRTAIERDLREAVAAGRETVLTELAPDGLSVIRSNTLRQALELGDPLVTEVLGHAAEVLGYACLTVRHLIDPAVIVLGGGMLEACSGFIMPIVEKIVGEDCLPGARRGGDVLVSALADDAVVLGAVALARTEIGDDPFKKGSTAAPTYSEIVVTKSGRFKAGEKSFGRDFYVTVGRRAKSQKVPFGETSDARPRVTPEHLVRACQGGPEVLFVGTGPSDQVELTEPARVYLRRRAIECEALPTPEAVKAYNRSTQRKAALIHVGEKGDKEYMGSELE
jgi:glucokinase